MHSFCLLLSLLFSRHFYAMHCYFIILQNNFLKVCYNACYMCNFSMLQPLGKKFNNCTCHLLAVFVIESILLVCSLWGKKTHVRLALPCYELLLFCNICIVLIARKFYASSNNVSLVLLYPHLACFNTP